MLVSMNRQFVRMVEYVGQIVYIHMDFIACVKILRGNFFQVFKFAVLTSNCRCCVTLVDCENQLYCLLKAAQYDVIVAGCWLGG